MTLPPRPKPPPSAATRSARWFCHVDRESLPPAAWVRASRQLAAGLVVIALLGCIPVLPVWGSEGPEPLPPWAVLFILVGVLQAAFAAYFALWPADASALVVASFGLLTTAGYAMLLAVRMLVRDDHAWSRFWQLDVNSFTRSQEAGWCFVMLLLVGMWTYLAGRLAVFWFRWNRDQAGQ